MFKFQKIGRSLECGKLKQILQGLNRTKTPEFLQMNLNDLIPFHNKKSVLFNAVTDYEIKIAIDVEFNLKLTENDILPLTEIELQTGPDYLKELIETGKLGALLVKYNLFFLFDDSEFEDDYDLFLSNIRALIFSTLIKRQSIKSA